MMPRPRAAACPNGHAYTPANVALGRGGWRTCRLCAAARAGRRREANVAARMLAERAAGADAPTIATQLAVHAAYQDSMTRLDALLMARWRASRPSWFY